MMKKLGLVLVAALAAIGGAQARAADVPQPVIDAVQALITEGWLPYDPEDPDNSGPPPPTADAAAIRQWQRKGLLRKVNLTPGKAPDWLIDTEKSEYPAAWCGTGGCLVEIWSPGPDGDYLRIFRNQIRLYKVHRLAGKDHGWLETDFHGSACGQTGSVACPWGYEWRDDGLGRPALRAAWHKPRKPILHPGAPPVAIDALYDDRPDAIPAELGSALADIAAVCMKVGGVPDTGLAAVRTPDINADGIDDWMLDTRWLGCVWGEDDPDARPDYDPCADRACGEQPWLSHRTGDTVLWTPIALAPDTLYAFDLRPDAATTLVALRDKPGAKADPDMSCLTMDLSQCVTVPISLSPNAAESPTTP